jgi:hypothetical protein
VTVAEKTLPKNPGATAAAAEKTSALTALRNGTRTGIVSAALTNTLVVTAPWRKTAITTIPMPVKDAGLMTRFVKQSKNKGTAYV